MALLQTCELGHPEWFCCLHHNCANGVAAKSCQFLTDLLKDNSLEHVRSNEERERERERERGLGGGEGSGSRTI